MFKKINAELVPLCHENINVTVTNNIAMIKLEQFYFNSNDEFIEAEYIFPSNEQIVFSELQMRFKDNVICTRIEERSIINEVFEIDSGKALAVTTTSQLAKDIEVINLGNIPPKSEIMIECTYFLKLSVEDLSWCLYIPSKIIPKYMGELSNNKSKENEESESSIEKEYREKIEGMSEAVRAYYQNLNFTYDFEIILNSSFQLTRVISTTHNIYTDFVDDKETRAVIRLTDPSTLFDSDFKLLFRNEEINKPIILTQKLGDERALMVSFLADLTSEVDKEKRQASISSKIDIDNTLNYEDYFDSNINCGEYYFVLDRSGSMIGQSIETAKKALILFLRSLPPCSKFNVVSFGTDYKFMFKNAVDYNQEHLESAISEVQKFEADMNGTEIYMPLNQIYSQKDGSSSLDKYVYLLTDGKVENTDEVIKLVKDNSSSFTVHTIGIGASASTSLVVGCANAGKGDYHFVKSKAVGLKTTVIEALSKSYFPYIFIKDQELRCSGNIIDQSNEFKESQIKLVHGDQLTYYAIIDKLESDKLEGILKLNLFNPKINKTELLEYELSTQSMEVEGSTLFKLIANREIIESTAMYDDKFAMKISVNYQVLSNFSSFIVEEKVPYVLSNKVEGEDNAHSSQSVENSISNKLDSLKPTSHKPAYSPLLQYRMTVHIKLLTGNTLDILISSNYDVEDLKVKIYDEEQIPIDKQRIVFKGKLLEDGKRLSEYGICHDSILHIVLRVRGSLPCFWFKDLCTGITTKLIKNVQSESTIADLKKTISNIVCKNQEDLKIYYDSLEILYPDTQTFSDCGFIPGEIFTVWYPTYMDIVNYQNVLGYWTIDVLNTINKTQEDVFSGVPESISSTLPNQDDQLKIVCTVLALKSLKSMYPQNESEWKLISIKGKNYIQAQGFNFKQLSLDL